MKLPEIEPTFRYSRMDILELNWPPAKLKTSTDTRRAEPPISVRPVSVRSLV